VCVFIAARRCRATTTCSSARTGGRQLARYHLLPFSTPPSLPSLNTSCTPLPQPPPPARTHFTWDPSDFGAAARYTTAKRMHNTAPVVSACDSRTYCALRGLPEHNYARIPLSLCIPSGSHEHRRTCGTRRDIAQRVLRQPCGWANAQTGRRGLELRHRRRLRTRLDGYSGAPICAGWLYLRGPTALRWRAQFTPRTPFATTVPRTWQLVA